MKEIWEIITTSLINDFTFTGHCVQSLVWIIMNSVIQLSRGPTLGEISYALAEITEIKPEIVKSPL